MAKIHSTIINDQTVKAKNLTASKRMLEKAKIMKVCSPAMGSLLDSLNNEEAFDMTLTGAFTLINENVTEEHMESLFNLMFSTLIDDEGKPVTSLDDYLELRQLDETDLFIWLFKVQLLDGIVNSDWWKSFSSITDNFKGLLPQKEEITKTVLLAPKEIKDE
jgi:hypothetical protein